MINLLKICKNSHTFSIKEFSLKRFYLSLLISIRTWETLDNAHGHTLRRRTVETIPCSSFFLRPHAKGELPL